ncbi:MAG: DUF362 domain-containing protein, partial [Muribaculaceae bacterium]|nr:DUF362 domain-containing protein [Muribaculaceae bacterium]
DVYKRLIKDITPENLVKIYEALGRPAEGKVAVKLSTGEPGIDYHLAPSLIAPLVQKLNGTIVECNTAYNGGRDHTADHLKAAADHGFTAVAPVVILDAQGEDTLAVAGGKHLKENYVGKDWKDYDFTVVLSHFKGHPMAGFGGAMKNISIGLASSRGKCWIHSGGQYTDKAQVWANVPADSVFQESMAEASKSVIDAAADKILYINVANNLSVDCDCVSKPAKPEMGDLGIFASLDPVALDRACLDAVFASDDHGKIHLIERINSRSGQWNLEYAEKIGAGTRSYKLVTLE